jgi:thymidylate kinase
MPTVFAIEGLDRLGKSTLIEGIRNKLGYHEVIHFQKPVRLNAYAGSSAVAGVPASSLQLYHYQQAGFRNSMLLAKSGARIIFDRWHLGECVYAPMYRLYNGDYVFDFERYHNLDSVDIRLILLTEDISISRHFVDDGGGFTANDDREEEQNRFISAFNRSIIRDKRIICVTDQNHGGFKPRDQVLSEALA